MSAEPAVKKIKLQLTDPDEPLTQQDVIAFQKEALFRSLNHHRVNVESLRTQYDLSRRQCRDISRKLANLMALVVTLARFLSSFCQNDEEKQLCRQVAEGDETVIVQLSDSFMRLLTKYSVQTANQEASQRVTELVNELKNLQKHKDELFYENKQLREEATALKSFYEDLIHKYDRDDSLTVKRVFNKEKQDETQVNDNDKDRHSNGIPPQVKEDSLNGAAIKEEVTPVKECSTNDAIEHDLQLSELRSQVEILQITIDELQKFKIQNEQELVKLRQQVSAQQSQFHPKIQDRDTLLERIQHLSKENEKFSQVNEDLLSKFQELSREKEIYTGKLTQELQAAQDTLKKHNATLEKDLVRIRTARDELLSKVAILEAEVKKSSMLNDLKSAIDILKDQWNRLETRSSNEAQPQDALMKELQDLEIAFKELSNITHKKYSEYLNQESVISKFSVEKTKADQKYFAAMRSKDSILVENKNLSKSLTKSNDLISQMKDSDKLLQQKIGNLNKQLQLSQGNEKRLIDSNKSTTLKLMDMNSELSKMKKALDLSREENHKNIAELTQVQTQLQNSELELKSLKIKATNVDAKCQKLQNSLLTDGGDNGPLVEELENFRSLVYCSLCSKNWKNMAIKNCGHVFCESCCKERLASRMRKCPTCNKAFSSNDLLLVHL